MKGGRRMSGLRTYFEKAGGMNLLMQWCRAGVLPVAGMEFLVLGRSKKALELLRLVVGMKVQQKLCKKYSGLLDGGEPFVSQSEHRSSRRIWVFWWQGMEHAPLLVRKCHASVVEHFPDWKITVLTADNYRQYVSFPAYIEEKREKGIISLTHFSDLLRIELLIRYGGLWLDATVLCTGSDIPKSVLKSDLFVFQAQKPGADGHAVPMSSWFIYSKTNNRILMATRTLLYGYWSREDNQMDYFIFHHFFTIACRRFPEEAKAIPPFCNSVPHILLLHLFDPYDEDLFGDLKRMTCFHKLSYKFGEEDMGKKGTFYDVIVNSKGHNK